MLINTVNSHIFTFDDGVIGVFFELADDSVADQINMRKMVYKQRIQYIYNADLAGRERRLIFIHQHIHILYICSYQMIC